MSRNLVFTDLKWFLRVTSAMLTFVAIYILQTASGKAIFPITQSIQTAPPDPGIMTAEVLSLNLSVWVAFLLLVSASSYFVLSTTGFGWYIRNLLHRLNFMRWLHHSISTSLMVTITALVAGLNSAVTLGLIFIFTVAVIMFGFLMEIYNERRKRIVWHAYVIGLLVMIAGWVALVATIVVTKYSLVIEIASDELWLYAVVSMFLGLFSLNMMLHYQKIGPWADYIFDEKSYILLDFVAKTSFALIVYRAFLV